MRRLRGFVPQLLLLFFVSVAHGADHPAAAADALQQGIEQYRAGARQEALHGLRSFVARNSDSPLLPEAYLYLARILIENGQPEEALLYLNRIAEDARSPEQRLLKGAALVAAGRTAEGVSLLQNLEDEPLAGADRYLRRVFLARGYAGQGAFLRALVFLHEAESLPAAPAGEVIDEAHRLRERLSDAELAEAIFMFTGTAIGDDLRLQKAERALAGGDREYARLLAAEVVRSPRPSPAREAAVQFLERLLAGKQVERAVGVILPLSGRFAPFGSQVRRGMELALQVRGDRGIRFRFVDADDAEQSARAVSELANEHGVMAIAGPLTGSAAAAAAARAQQEEVPLLTLSQREGLAEQGGYVFRDSLTPRLQVQALVKHAMAERQLTDFAVLFPENKLGREMADLFAQEVGARGGRIVARQSYAESATDFRRQVRLLQGRDPAVADEEGAAPEKPRFQALFIPEDAERVGLIAPQLVFYGLEGVQLLGSSGWNSLDLLRLAGKYVAGAVFVDGFYLYSLRPAVSEFVNLYMDRYGEEPSILSAQGFDAAGILLTAFSDPAVTSRAALRQALLQLRNYRGVAGTTGFDAGGEAEKNLFLLQVQDGAIVQIN